MLLVKLSENLINVDRIESVKCQIDAPYATITFIDSVDEITIPKEDYSHLLFLLQNIIIDIDKYSQTPLSANDIVTMCQDIENKWRKV